MPQGKSAMFDTLYLWIKDCLEAAIGILGNPRRDRVLCAIPKFVPICVSGLMVAEKIGLIWTIFTFFCFHVFPLGKYQKGQEGFFWGRHFFCCAARACAGLCQFPWKVGDQPHKYVRLYTSKKISEMVMYRYKLNRHYLRYRGSRLVPALYCMKLASAKNIENYLTSSSPNTV